MKHYAVVLILLSVIFSGIFFAVEPIEQTRLVVEKVMPNSPHEKAGILPNDILIKYDGKPISSFKELGAVKEQIVKDSIEVVFLRGQQEIKFKIAKGQSGVSVKEYLPDIKYKDDAVIIQGIPKLGWEKMNSFFGSLELVANHLGINRDYTWINGVSGAAFRLHFCKDWCPSSPDPTCGFNSGEEALKALGLEYKSYNLASDGKNKPEILKAIKQSIDNDRPVIAIDLLQVPEWGLITGYQNNGEELLCRTYFDRRQGYEIAEKFPWAVYIITGKKTNEKYIDPYPQSFKTILANLTTKNYDQYYSGINAFDQWINHLEKSDFAKMDSQKYNNAILANGWIFDRLAIDRKDGADYLNYVAAHQMSNTEGLFELAYIYEQESKLLQETKINIPNSNIIKNTSEWTPEMRKEEVALLKEAKAKEEAALKIWQDIVKKVK
jgi:hypothetical protein